MVAEFEHKWSVWPCRRRGGVRVLPAQRHRHRQGTPWRNHRKQGGAYPNEEINTLNTAAPSTHFLSAQSVYVDSSDTLWVLDVGNLGSGTPLIRRANSWAST